MCRSVVWPSEAESNVEYNHAGLRNLKKVVQFWSKRTKWSCRIIFVNHFKTWNTMSVFNDATFSAVSRSGHTIENFTPQRFANTNVKHAPSRKLNSIVTIWRLRKEKWNICWVGSKSHFWLRVFICQYFPSPVESHFLLGSRAKLQSVFNE